MSEEMPEPTAEPAIVEPVKVTEKTPFEKLVATQAELDKRGARIRGFERESAECEARIKAAEAALKTAKVDALYNGNELPATPPELITDRARAAELKDLLAELGELHRAATARFAQAVSTEAARQREIAGTSLLYRRAKLYEFLKPFYAAHEEYRQFASTGMRFEKLNSELTQSLRAGYPSEVCISELLECEPVWTAKTPDELFTEAPSPVLVQF